MHGHELKHVEDDVGNKLYIGDISLIATINFLPMLFLQARKKHEFK